MKKKIKILRIISRLAIGGSTYHAIVLTAHQDKEVFDCTLVRGTEGPTEGTMLEFAHQKGVKSVRYVPDMEREISVKRDALALWKLYRLIRRERPDIVDTHQSKAGALGRLAAILAGTKVRIHTIHGHVFYNFFGKLKTSFIVLVERFLARYSTLVVAVSENVRKEVLAFKVGTPEKVVTIPYGIELDKYLSIDGHRGNLRRELGFSEKDIVIGNVQRLVPTKGHSYLFEGIRLLKETAPEVRFVIAGDGEIRAELERLVESLGLVERVHFLGFREDVDNIYADSDALIFPSLTEGAPFAIIEALASGRPVVATDVGGISELIDDGKCGFVVPARDPKALAQALLKLIRDENLRRTFGENARRKVYPHLSHTRLVKDMEKIYLELVNSSRNGG
jgi:glycosyltransferase involved in cell wall biosynthesis